MTEGALSPSMSVLLAGIISTLATGLGAIPVMLIRRRTEAFIGLFYSAAAGIMMSASVFSIGVEGLHLGTPWEVAIGFILGGAFLSLTAWLLPHDEGDHDQGSARSTLMLLALFAHSIPEGIAIGVGFATDQPAFGVLLAIAIAIHNIPEGTAMSLPLRQQGASFWRCFWTSVLTSLPQAVLALPSFLFVNYFRILLPGGLAFAGGAMIFLVVFDLLPEAFSLSKRKTAVAWSFLLGLTGMMLVTVLLERFNVAG